MKKFFLIAGLIVVLIIVIGVVFVALNKNKLVGMAMDKGFATIEQVTIQSLPNSVSADSVKADFATALEKVKTGTADNDQLKGFILNFQNAMQDKKLDSLEVVNILDALEKI